MNKTASSKERITQKYFVVKTKTSPNARRKAQECIHNSPGKFCDGRAVIQSSYMQVSLRVADFYGVF